MTHLATQAEESIHELDGSGPVAAVSGGYGESMLRPSLGQQVRSRPVCVPSSFRHWPSTKASNVKQCYALCESVLHLSNGQHNNDNTRGPERVSSGISDQPWLVKKWALFEFLPQQKTA